MHLLDGGVIKYFLQVAFEELEICPNDPMDPVAGTHTILPKAEKLVQFLKQFSLNEQARQIRYI